jgi:magnesium-transporting ATPase (P-type)
LESSNKDVADMVLLEKDLGVLVEGIQEGRIARGGGLTNGL